MTPLCHACRGTLKAHEPGCPMTKTPEERAREIAQSILLSPYSIPFLGTVTAEKIIAAALRAAENEALERAARLAETMKYGPTYFSEGRLNAGPIIGGEDIASAIRALKGLDAP